MLKDPEAVYPGQRKMVKYDFTEEQIQDVIAFFEWIGRMDLNGFPPKPTIGLASAAAIAIPGGERPKIFTQVCVACHSLGGIGGTFGPALDGVGDKFDRGYLMRWITDPQAVKGSMVGCCFRMSGLCLAALSRWRGMSSEADARVVDVCSAT